MSALSDFLGAGVQLGTSFINAKYGTPPFIPVGTDMIPDWMQNAPVIGPMLPADPGLAQSGQMMPKGYVFNPNANCGVGAWQKKRRRRRPMLITPSEVGQLQSLMGVAGKNSDITKTWIATRRRG